jgi:hypothetical protein
MQVEGLPELVGLESGVGRAGSRDGIFLGGNGENFLWGDLKSRSQLNSFLDHEAGVLMPCGVARGGKVIDAAGKECVLLFQQKFSQHLGRHISNQGRPGGGSALIDE